MEPQKVVFAECNMRSTSALQSVAEVAESVTVLSFGQWWKLTIWANFLQVIVTTPIVNFKANSIQFK